MSIKTYYAFGKSKKALNERLAAGEHVYVDHYTPEGCEAVPILALNSGDILKIYEKMVHGSPYAKAYGNWDSKKKRIH